MRRLLAALDPAETAVMAENIAALAAITWGAHGLWGAQVAALVAGGLVLLINLLRSIGRSE